MNWSNRRYNENNWETLEESGFLKKGIKNEVKEQKGEFLQMLLGTLAASILGNTLSGRGVIRDGEGVIRTGQNF